MDWDTPRVAYVTLAKYETAPGVGQWLWHMPACPWCGRPYTYTAGPLTSDPRAFLGKIVAHCSGLRAPHEYILTEKP